MRHTLKIILAYDGSRYHGWQRQSKDSSIQEVIEEQIQMMLGESITVIASGRTDAGVHALNQVCHFQTNSEIALGSLKRGLNSLLPDDIFIKEVDYVPADFHARYHAKSKTYQYWILNRKAPDIFRRYYHWHIKQSLSTRKMNDCMGLLVGTHDFSAFKSSGSKNKNPVRTMIAAKLDVKKNGEVCCTFEADGFLRHMVRNMVGTIVEVGLGRFSVEDFKRILMSCDRQLAGKKAPPQGLFLKEVRY